MPIKILVIDDDTAMIELLILLLSSKGFCVKTAVTGEDGLRIIHEFSPDIIILDLMMPGLNGWDVCLQVRQFSRIPILVLSALDNPGNVVSALDAGADDYLVKPVPTGVLVAHINNLTRRTSVTNQKDNLSVEAMTSMQK